MKTAEQKVKFAFKIHYNDLVIEFVFIENVQLKLTLSKYFGIRLSRSSAVLGDNSDGFNITQFPAVMAPIIGLNDS